MTKGKLTFRICRCFWLLGLFPPLGITARAFGDVIQDALTTMSEGGCKTARETWLPLAENGDPVAQYEIGMTYQFGSDYGCEPPDNAWEAAKWYKRASEKGNVEATTELAYVYYTGNGAVQNYSDAMRLWRLAASKGDVDSNYFIGLLFQEGQGVPQNYSTAAIWFRKAAERGDFQAQFAMGYIYKEGEGVPKDNVEAHMWLNLAAAQSDNRSALSAKQRDELASKMTSAEIAEAQARASRWRPK